ncbi:hypothetical protein HYY73_00750 [Candidatus Woesearchaeota archaeon]|nr:hypothetical protein [Candidatus Woesearchaeota archaeon]
MNPLSVRLENLVEGQLSEIQRIATTSHSVGYVSASGAPFDPKNPFMAYSEARLIKMPYGRCLYSLRMRGQPDGSTLSQKFLEFQRLTEDIAVALYNTLQEQKHVLMQLPVKDFRFGFDSLPEVMIVGYTPETEHAPPLLGSIIIPQEGKTALALEFQYSRQNFKVLKAPGAGPRIKLKTAVPKIEYVSVLQNPQVVVKDIEVIAGILGMRPESIKQNFPRRYPWLFVGGRETTLSLLERFAYLQARIRSAPRPPEARQRILDGILGRLQEYENNNAGLAGT